MIKQNLVVNGKMDMQTKVMISTFSMIAELERDFVSFRTKEALKAKKADGVKLGRPKGPGKSKLDEHESEIRELLDLGVPKTRIAEKLNVSVQNLHHWLRKRGIR